MTTTQTTTRVLLATVAGALAAAVVSVGSASAAPKLTPCASAVINDWVQHEPNLTGTHPHRCYLQALKYLNSQPDIKGYSSALEDIHRAMLAALKNPSGPSGPGSSNASGGKPTAGPTQPARQPAQHTGFIGDIADKLRPGSAQSIPLPLLVLAGLAILLLLAAAATWFARRIQTRRVTPAPAPAPTPRR